MTEEDEFYKAVADLDVKTVLRLISEGADVNEEVEHHGPLLCVACLVYGGSSEDFAIVKALIGAKAKVNKRDTYGFAPLHYAAQKGDLDLVKFLLRCGARINSKTKKGHTPISLAAGSMYATAGVINELLCRGADYNLPDNEGRTPLHFAAKNWNIDALRILLAAGADPYEKDKKGRTAIDVAADQSLVKIIKENRIALFKDSHNKEFIYALMDQIYYEFKYKDDIDLNHLLEITINDEYPDQDINRWIDKNGETPLHYAVHFNDAQSLRNIVKAKDFYGNKFNILQKNNKGKTAMRLAIEEGKLSCVQALAKGYPYYFNKMILDSIKAIAKRTAM